MPVQPINTLKTWFETADKPTQNQFWDWLDSFFHKSELIPQASVTDLIVNLNQLLTKTEFNAFEQGELIAYNADAIYAIPAGFLLEKIICQYGAIGTIKLSIVANGDEDVLPQVDVAAGWNKPIEVNIVAEAITNFYIAGIPNNSKILFIKRKLKMA